MRRAVLQAASPAVLAVRTIPPLAPLHFRFTSPFRKSLSVPPSIPSSHQSHIFIDGCIRHRRRGERGRGQTESLERDDERQEGGERRTRHHRNSSLAVSPNRARRHRHPSPSSCRRISRQKWNRQRYGYDGDIATRSVAGSPDPYTLHLVV